MHTGAHRCSLLVEGKKSDASQQRLYRDAIRESIDSETSSGSTREQVAVLTKQYEVELGDTV